MLNELIVTLNITMNAQVCRRADPAEAFVCSTSAPAGGRTTVTLQPVPPTALEEQAFEGAAPDVALSLSGSGQYMPWVHVRKSVAQNGASVIYTLRFRAQSMEPQLVGANSVYETVFISEDSLRMSEPLTLLADRKAGDREIKQIYFTVMPAVQFAGLVRDPED